MIGRPKGSKNKWNSRWHLPLADRFWEKVYIRGNDDCWEWRAFIHPKGYGTIAINRKMFGAHRVAWELTYGEIPEGLFVLHHCDNRKCCNPKHLFLGTIKDNAQDMALKGRGRVPDNRGEKHGMNKLTEEQIKHIRELYSNGEYSQYKLGIMFNVSHQYISKVISRKAWSWLE